MTSNKPAAEVTISHDLIHTMLKEFVPELADQPLTLHGEGWDNEIHRLGDDHAVRLPRREAAATLIEHEQRWLPELAEVLPLPIPTPTYSGRPAFGFPWAWSIVPWLPGIPLAHTPRPEIERLMDELSGFLNALHTPAPEDAPENPHRGGLLSDRSDLVHERIDQIADIDAGAVHTLWEELVDTPVWGGDSDVAPWRSCTPLNLLVRGGRLSAVIDFGDITAGDPATDLSVAWMVFDVRLPVPKFRKQLDDRWAQCRHPYVESSAGLGVVPRHGWFWRTLSDDPTMRQPRRGHTCPQSGDLGDNSSAVDREAVQRRTLRRALWFSADISAAVRSPAMFPVSVLAIKGHARVADTWAGLATGAGNGRFCLRRHVAGEFHASARPNARAARRASRSQEQAAVVSRSWPVQALLAAVVPSSNGPRRRRFRYVESVAICRCRPRLSQSSFSRDQHGDLRRHIWRSALSTFHRRGG